MVTITQMKALVVISEKGSLAAAARALSISAAAISKQLILLEKELGLQLLIRTTRSLEFTEIGKSYCDQCKRILEECEVASELVDQMKTVPHGHLKVVSSPFFASLYILPYLGEFLSLFPQIELDLELTERFPNLNEEAVDILIGTSLPSAGNVIQKRIMTSRGCFCASPDYLAKFGTPKTPKDLIHHRHIIHSMRKPPNILKFSKKESVTITPFFRVNDSEAMVKLALQGLGIIKAHYPLVRDYLKNETLVELLPNYIEKEFPLYVAFPERRYVSSKVRSFIDFIMSKIEAS